MLEFNRLSRVSTTSNRVYIIVEDTLCTNEPQALMSNSMSDILDHRKAVNLKVTLR
jgi:hypothetical protein